MELKILNTIFETHGKIQECIKGISENKGLFLKNLIGSSKSIFISRIINQFNNAHLIILPDKETAAYFHNDLSVVSDNHILFFPTSFKRSIIYGQEDNSNLLLRAETLQSLANNEHSIIVTYPEAIIEKVINKDKLISSTLKLSVGEQVSIDFIQEVLQEYHFQYVDFVYEPGQYSIRGSIIDIFSFASDDPYRIDFFGDEVDSIRSFDVENQLSKQSFEIISIVPKIVNPESENKELKQTE